VTTFRLGNLDDWRLLDGDNPRRYDIGDAPYSVVLEAVASEPVALYVNVDGGDGPQLVAQGSGSMRVKFTASAAFVLSAVGTFGDSCPEVWIKGKRLAQTVAESDIPSFTTIEPRGVGPSSDLQRMMRMIQINAQRREAILRDEMVRMGEALAARSPAAPVAAPAAAVEAPADAG
jgi:hypothetical protein